MDTSFGAYLAARERCQPDASEALVSEAVWGVCTVEDRFTMIEMLERRYAQMPKPAHDYVGTHGDVW